MFAPRRTRSVLVDTNLLLLLVVGSYDREQIPHFKRTERFTKDDFDLLVDALGPFKIMVTPHVLAETSNLLGKGLQEPARTGVLTKLYASLDLLLFTEVPIAARDTAKATFVRFGLTDAGIEQAASDALVILTDDLRLSGYLGRKGLDVVNFNHLRWHDYLAP